MTPQIVCIPVDHDRVGPSWGKAPQVAIATVVDGAITAWETHVVDWHISHDAGTHGSHHARVVKFLLDHDVTAVVADHMGPPMQNTLAKMGVHVLLGASGNARAAVMMAAD